MDIVGRIQSWRWDAAACAEAVGGWLQWDSLLYLTSMYFNHAPRNARTAFNQLTSSPSSSLLQLISLSLF
jgi:hypothetical protein